MNVLDFSSICITHRIVYGGNGIKQPLFKYLKVNEYRLMIFKSAKNSEILMVRWTKKQNAQL